MMLCSRLVPLFLRVAIWPEWSALLLQCCSGASYCEQWIARALVPHCAELWCIHPQPSAFNNTPRFTRFLAASRARIWSSGKHCCTPSAREQQRHASTNFRIFRILHVRASYSRPLKQAWICTCRMSLNGDRDSPPHTTRVHPGV
jgi:hypothetical protein